MAQPWEMNWGGPAPSATPTYIPPLPRSAAQQAEEERRQQDQQFEAQRIAMEQERLRLQQDAAARQAAQPAPGPTAAQQRTTMQGANLDALVGQINRVQDLFNSGQRDNAIPLLGSLTEYFPTQENTQFDAAAAGLAEQGLAAFRVPGVGAQSDTELRQFVEANKPSTWSNDSSNLERLRQLRNRVDATRAALGLPPAEWTGLDTQQDQRRQAPPTLATAGGQTGGQAGNGGPPAPPPITPFDNNPSAGGQSVATGGTRSVFDAETAAILNGMVRSGAPYEQAAAAVQARGFQPPSQAQYGAAVQWQRTNPTKPYNAANPTREEAVSIREQISASPGGAYLGGARTGLTAGFDDELAGLFGADRDAFNANKNAVAANQPGWDMTGQMSGQMLAGLTGEAALARLGMAPGFVRGLLADTGTGAATGAGMADTGNRGMGALGGGLTAATGSSLGTGTMNLAGRALRPTGGELADLYGAGVRPTPGQRFANSGTMGRILNTTEEALQSVPVVGQAIRGARQQARDQFQIGAFNEALSEIGETLPKGMKPGTDPQAFTQSAFNRVYEQARSGMRLAADEELSAELGQLAPDIATLGPASQKKLKAIMANNVNNRLVNGEMGGGAYKKSMADLGRHIARFRNSPMAEDQALADVLDGVRGALDSAARRNSDPDAVALLDAADAGYAKLVRIEEAAARRGGGAGVFSPANFDSAVQRASGGVRSKAYSRGDALMQDYAKAGRSLEDTLPNSGTADRVMAGYAVGTPVAGAAVYAEPVTAALLGTIATAYAPGVRRATTGMLAPPGPSRKWIARQLEKRARLLGRTGAAGAVAYPPGTSGGQ